MVQFFISPLNLGNINFGSLGLVVLTKGGDGGTPPTIGTSLVVGTFIASSIYCLQSIIFAMATSDSSISASIDSNSH